MKGKLRHLLALALVLMSVVFAQAQQKSYTGTVVSASEGHALPLVSIKISGTNQGTATDSNGKFTISAKKGDKLEFSFVGLANQTVALGDNTNLVVKMQDDSAVLDDMVVIAYGTAKKESFTGSAGVVKADKLEKRQVASITKAIEGTVTGVMTTSGSGQPGSGASIIVRGIGSINASSSPLYVVDGTPYDGSIAAINPNDIETISILKDASAGALYGARGANGVVMITTKRGKNNDGRVNASLKAVWGVASRSVPRYDMMNEAEYIQTVYSSLKNKLIYSDGVDPRFAGKQAVEGLLVGPNAIFGGDNRELYNPYNMPVRQLVDSETGAINPEARLRYSENWMDEVTAEAPIRQEYVFSVNGGTKKTTMLASLGYLNEQGVLKTTAFERFTGRVNADTQVNDWFKIGASTNFSFSKSTSAPDGDTSNSNVWYTAASMGPIFPVFVKNDDGSNKPGSTGGPIFDYGDYRPAGASSNFNSVATLYEDYYENQLDQLSARGFAEIGFNDDQYGFLKGLSLTAQIGLDNVNQRATTYYNPDFGNGQSSKGRLSKSQARTFSYTFSQLAKYNRTFGKHNIDVLLGHEFYSYKYNLLSAAKTGFPFSGLIELAPGSTITAANSYENNYRLESYLSRVNYSFNDKYYFSGSFRTDGSSRFHKDSRWGKFWSLGASWRISQENFMQNTSAWLNNITLRASYGVQGNDNVGTFYAWQAFYNLGWPNAGSNGSNVTSLESAGLKWEKNGNFNIGLEGRIFDRFNITIEYFNRLTSDLLLSVPMATSLGFDSYLANVGSMRNTGVELALTAEIIRSRDVSWSVTALGSAVQNKVIKLVNGKDIPNGSNSVIREGHPIYSYNLPKSAGIDPATGVRLYYVWDMIEVGGQKVPGATYISSDYNKANNSREICGAKQPDFYGSFSTDLKFKNFDLSVLTTYSIGGVALDGTYLSYMNNLYVGSNMHRNLLNAWSKPGDITDIPRVNIGDNAYTTTQSDLVNASYFSIKNITLGYTLPNTALAKIGLGSVRVYASGDNLAMFSKLKGFNPEASVTGGGTSYSYMPVRTISLGLNLNF